MSMNFQTISLLEFALKYRAYGFSVIPVGIDKKPLIEWKKFQSVRASREEIHGWWRQWPDANVGIVTGAISGIVVVDVDSKNASALKGLYLPPTPIVRTAKGFHYYFKHPGHAVSNPVRIRESIDIRGDGGFVVAPPSLHKSGVRYEWTISPEDSEFADLPKWVLERSGDGKTTRTDWKEFSVSQITEGSRNDMATRFIGKLLHDLSPEFWESVGWTGLVNWNSNNVKPALTEIELKAVFESIAKKEAGSRATKTPKVGGTRRKAVITCVADVQPEPISWLWPGRIALGKLTLIAGDPGLGKSLLTAYLAACVSKGYSWPIEGSAAPTGDVVMLSAEDDVADTIRPRLDAAGADCTRIHILKAVQDVDAEGTQTQRMFSFKQDLAVLEELLPIKPDCRLLVIDPVSAYLDGTDSNKNSDLRGLFAPLAELAARHKIAVILIQHLNKGGGGSAIYRPMGSLAFIAAARAAYIVTKDQNNPERRLLMPAKNNLAKDTTGLAYTVIRAENGAPAIAWEFEPVTITADEALALPEPDEERTATDEAVDLLRGLLSNGPVKVSEVQKEARGAGISDKALRRARERLGIKPKKTAFSSGWEWGFDEDANMNEGAPSEGEGILGDGGHLGETTGTDELGF